MSPTGHFLFSSIDGSSNAVGEFLIDGNGLLSANTPATIAAGSIPGGSGFSPDGGFFFVTDYGDGTVKSYTVGANGTLTFVNSASTGAHPQQIVVDKTTHFAFVTNFSSNTVSQYHVGVDGSLSGNGGAATGAQPYGLAISPDNHHLYVCNRGDGTVSQFNISAGTGALSDIAAAVQSGSGAGSDPCMIAVDATGKFAYAANDGGIGAATITSYAIATDGHLTVNGADKPVGTATGFEYVVIDPSNHFVAAYSTGSNMLYMFSIGVDGTLTQLGNPTPVMAQGVAGIAFGP